MKRSTTALFFPAIGISAALHVALMVFLPYRAARPPLPPARELVPVSLLYRQVPVPASPPPEAKLPQAVQAATPAQELPAPLPVPEAGPELEPIPDVAPAAEEPPQERLAEEPERPVPMEGLAEESERSTEGSPAEPGRSVEGPAEVAIEAASHAASSDSAAPGAEIAGYQAILSILRGRILRETRYPALARVSGWKGTVVLSVRLDSAGRLEQAVVRRSSGYEVLDRAAAALLQKVTPVSNPLARPVSIEIPIAYELK